VARAHGAHVFERSDLTRAGKGHALAWLLDAMQHERAAYDAYVVLDADSTVSQNFLSAMSDRMQAGARVVQGYYDVLPLHGTVAESLRRAALALVHYLRPSAKTALGASCGLKGNGMCFGRDVLTRFGWPSAGLAEDVEFHLQLVAAGIVVEFAPEAIIRAEMPSSLRGAGGQNMRWEAGRLATVRGDVLPLLRRGLRRRDPVALDAAVEQLVPPLSVPVMLALVCLVLGLLFGLSFIWQAAALLLGVVALYVLVGLVIARVPPRVYVVLAAAPFYAGWKALLYARALSGRHERRWIRTERALSQDDPVHP
jgi:cellulose synthase/poly-beta-1,6-N-acetylglucosamine synthase-like glycosyltransferase